MTVKWSGKFIYWLVLPLSIAVVPPLVIFFSGLSYYFLVAALSSVTSWYLWKNVSKHRSYLWLYVLNFVVLYVMIVFGGVFYDWFLEYQLGKFDLNGDSLFSIEEQTPEQIKYMELLVNDLGRNLLPLTGIIYSAAWIFVLSLLVYFSRLLRNREK